MSILTRVKEWVDMEVLEANDLNVEFDAIVNNIIAGTTASVGMVQLEDSHASTSVTKAACPKNVKEAYDLAGTMLTKATFDANTFIYSVSDNTPVVKTRAEVMALLSGQAGADFSIGTHKITAVVDPTADQDAATKKYVDDNSDGIPAGSQGNMLYKGASAWLAGQVEFNPNMYTGTDTQKIQAAVSAADAVGGTVHIVGSWAVTGQITIDGPCTIYGDGNNGGTIITTTNSNFVVFYINTENTVNIRDIKITDSGTPTAGSAIKVEYTGGSYNNRSVFEKLLIHNQYTGIDLVEATLYSVDKCHICDCKKYGIRVRNTASVDYGLATITNSYFHENNGSQDAAIRYESGGGLKVMGCWFLGDPNTAGKGHDYGIDLVVANGAVTVDLIIANNHFENLNNYYIRLDTATSSGSFHNIQIDNNEFVSWVNSTSKGILIEPTLDSQISDVTINGNIFNNCGVKTVNGTNIFIGDNIFQNGVGTNVTYAVENTGALNVCLGLNTFPGYTYANFFTGTFGVAHTGSGIRVLGAIRSDATNPFQAQGLTPGLWLDETGTGNKGAHIVLDSLVLHVQKTAQGFGAYETSPIQLNISTGAMTVLGCITDGTCEILTEDAISIIKDITAKGSGSFDKYGHEKFDMKRLYKKYPYLFRKTTNPDKTEQYTEKLGAKSDLLYRAIQQLEDRIKTLEK